MILADTSGLLAFFNRSEPTHRAVVEVVEAEDAALVVSPFVIAELDYLIASRLGVDAEMTALDELASGAYVLASFDTSDLVRASQVVARYRDQQVGLADASLVVLAERYETKRILTLDRRHFGVMRPPGGGRFSILP